MDGATHRNAALSPPGITCWPDKRSNDLVVSSLFSSSLTSFLFDTGSYFFTSSSTYFV